jgi:hypothetical protein
VGQAYAPIGRAVVLGVVLLESPLPADAVVTITSNQPSIVQVSSPTVIIPAGSRVAPIEIVTGTAGTATLTIESGGTRREFSVYVDASPVPSNTPVATAVPIGIAVVPLPGGVQLTAPVGTPRAATLGVQVLTAPRGDALQVTISTSRPDLVSLGAAPSATVTVDAGSTVAPLSVTTSGEAGVAVLTFEFDGVRRQILFVVGDVPASALPVILAPVIGVTVQP